ncbi:SPOR domain-containing protein [Pyruvatibacter sp.]|uniref:SPOR domain-containing protein n=1 Tax=Pyruvatibacter sp. TaxID=1981328 RepID=UPI0032EDBD47
MRMYFDIGILSHGWFGRLVASREAINTALAAALLFALVVGMAGKAHAEEVVEELGSYDRQMLTSLIEAVIAVDEGDVLVTAALPEAATTGTGPRSIIPTRRPDVVAGALSGAPVADHSDNSRAAASVVDPGFALQLGSFASAENAQRGFETANAQYGSVLTEHTLYVQPVDLGSRGVFHRLRIGGFETLPQASTACATLGIAAADCMIVSATQL